MIVTISNQRESKTFEPAARQALSLFIYPRASRLWKRRGLPRWGPIASQAADDRPTLLAQAIPNPVGALVLLPIQFVFDSPQRNAATKSLFDQFFAVHRYTASFAENDLAKGSFMRTTAADKNKKSRRGGTPEGIRPRRLTRERAPAQPGCSSSSHPTTSLEKPQSSVSPLSHIYDLTPLGGPRNRSFAFPPHLVSFCLDHCGASDGSCFVNK